MFLGNPAIVSTRACLCFLLLLAVAFERARASDDHSPSFYPDIAPIIYGRCTGCHRPGEAAPFYFLSYQDVRSRAGQIVQVTQSQFMPPWLPAAGDVAFKDQRRLTESELELIRRWAQGGARRGAEADRVDPPSLSTGWKLGEPDLILTVPEPYILPAGGRDVFRNLVLPIRMEKDRYVQGIEFRPGDTGSIHHVVFMIDPTSSSRLLDEQDPDVGFDGMILGSGARSPGGQISGWLPGKMPVLDAELSWRLNRNSDFVLQLHLLPTGKPESVRPTVGLYFTDKPPVKKPLLIRLGSQTYTIPAGADDFETTDEYRLPVDVKLLSIYPHAHYLGKTLRGMALLPDGTEKTLIRIPDWDFNWQDQYTLARPLQLPRGTLLKMAYRFDNSPDNIRNPNVPPLPVNYGPRSSDSMGDLWLQVLPGDERDYATLEQDHGRKELLAAIACGEHLIKQDPDNPSFCNSVGVGYEQIENYEKALSYYRRAIEIDPDHAPSHYNIGNVLLKQNRLEEGLAALEQARALDPDMPEIYIGLGLLHQKQSRFQQAAQMYAQAIKRNRDFALAYANLASLLESQHQHQEALPLRKKQVSLDPENANARVSLAKLLLRMEQPEAALEELRLAVEIRPSMPIIISLANVCRQMGQYEQAADYLKKALRFSPDNFLILTNLGNVALEMKDEQLALDYYRRAYKLNSLPEVALKLADIHIARGEVGEAVRYFTGILADHPEHVDGNRGAGFALMMMDRPMDALEHFAVVLRQRPGDFKSHYYAARCFEKVDDLDRAEASFTAALRLQSGNAQVRLDYCNLLIRRGQWVRASDQVDQVLSVDPGNARASALRRRIDSHL